jgi:HEPN domain-containing protein
MSTLYKPSMGPVAIEQGLLDQALSFFNGGSRCAADIDITPLATNSPMSPAIVCYAFSAELYLKLLHAIATGSAPKGHKLDDLFSSLTTEMQSEITGQYGNADLSTHIVSVSASFVEWRYLHEHETLTINWHILVKLCRACHKVVRRSRPDLKVFGENDVIHSLG